MFMALLAGSTVESGPVSAWMGYFDTSRCLVLLAGSLFIVWSLLRVISAQVVRRMERQGAASGSGLRMPGRIDFLLRVLILMVYAAQLTVGSWTKLVQAQWHMHRFILLDELINAFP